MKRWLLILLWLWGIPVHAQVGTCEPAEAEAYLDAGNVRARMFNNGALFWRGSPQVYEVPKGGSSNALFAAGIWIGAKIDGVVHAAASRYGPWEFWAGPLDEEGMAPASCKSFDKIWEITRGDLEAWVNNKEISNNLKNWPWQLGAPIIDGDGNPDNYNLEGGDFPELLGDQRLWWIMNDRGNAHNSFLDSDPLGIEVHASAFAFDTGEPLSNFTFYTYTIINKNRKPLDKTYFGLWSDGDLGNFDDDHVGSDSLLHLGYYYNADNDDEGGEGYGLAPPAIGFTFLQTPIADSDNIDNDRDGSIDEPGEMLGTSSALYFNNDGNNFGSPFHASHYYNFMQARWKDRSRVFEGYYGFGVPDGLSLNPTNFSFSGDPVTHSFWSEFNYDNMGSKTGLGDRRFLVSSGPFDITSGDTATVNFAIIWSRGEDHLDSVSKLKSHTRGVRSTADHLYTPMIVETKPIPPVQYVLGFDQNFPNPFTQSTTLRYSLPQPMQVRLAVYDLLGREVALLVDAQQEAGIHAAEFDAANLPAGVYLARIELDFLRFTKRMILLR